VLYRIELQLFTAISIFFISTTNILALSALRLLRV